MQCPHCGEELIEVEGEIEVANVELESAGEVQGAILTTLNCPVCMEDLMEYEVEITQDISDFEEQHDGHDLQVTLHDEHFSLLRANGHVSVGATGTIRVLCEDCSETADYEWSDYEPLNDVLSQME